MRVGGSTPKHLSAFFYVFIIKITLVVVVVPSASVCVWGWR